MPPESSTRRAEGRPARAGASRAWALDLFDHSLKKRQKLELLLRMAGPLEGRRCLLVTNGDNPGSLNWHLREAGGRWTWAEMEAPRIPAISGLLGDPVEHAAPDHLPFPDGSFDLVVVIDVHEHLDEVDELNCELARVAAPGGIVLLTTPNGDTRLPMARAKRLLGMTPEVYGHRVQGYTATELEEMARRAGLIPEARGAYSRFFTEGIELAINTAYVKVLGKSPDGERPPEGEIAPSGEDEIANVGGAYRLYRKVFPILRAVSRLDALIPGDGGYAVAVAARRPE
jgi:SAM-dependent methyltransferase